MAKKCGIQHDSTQRFGTFGILPSCDHQASILFIDAIQQMGGLERLSSSAETLYNYKSINLLLLQTLSSLLRETEKKTQCLIKVVSHPAQVPVIPRFIIPKISHTALASRPKSHELLRNRITWPRLVTISEGGP
jgi:hypothetical protein